MARSESDASRVEADIERVGAALDDAILELAGQETLELISELEAEGLL